MGAEEWTIADHFIEGALFSAGRGVVGGEGGLGFDRVDEFFGGKFEAAVMGGDEDLGFKLIGLGEQSGFGGDLDVAGEEDGVVFIGEAHDLTGIVGVEFVISRRPEDLQRAVAVELDRLAGGGRVAAQATARGALPPR